MADFSDFAVGRYIQWDALIIEIESTGKWKCVDIANVLNIAPTTLSAWKNEGKEPRHSSGEALLLLHRKIFGDEYTQKRITEWRKRVKNGPATTG